ncbi:hypothetical protein GX48_01396 [Paracoccidioides brasiliensis]|nr:hypothetical protein GX48_01396 [Paracoccidioides brasiliensis]
MARTFYDHQEDLQFYRQSSRGMSYPVSQPIRGDAQQELSSGYGGRIGSTPEPDAKSSGPLTRRRIQVACGRCRRRKIKCSGDSGNGQCTNCRNAGTSNCLFLRVNSFATQAKGGYSNSWPYPPASPLGPPYASTAGYESQATSRFNSTLIHSMTPAFPLYSKSQCAYEHAAQFSTLSRNPYMSVCQINYDGDSASSYNMSSPPYMLPSTDSSGSPNYCSYPLSPRGSQMSKISKGKLSPDQDGHSTLVSNYNCMTQTHSPVSISSDLPPTLPLLSSMSSSSGSDRTLPNPIVNKNGRESGITIQTSSTSSTESSLPPSYGTGQVLSARSANQFSMDGLPSNNQQSSMRTTATSTMSDGASSSSAVKSHTGATDMTFGYVISNNSPSTTMPSTPFPTTESVEGFHLPAEHALNGASHRYNELHQQAQAYGHSTELPKQCTSSGSSSNLTNGRSYTRLPPYQSTVSRCCEPSVKPISSLAVSKVDGF